MSCCAVELNPENMDFSYDMCSNLIEELMVKKEEYISSARNAQSHDMYSKLHYNIVPTLIQNYKSWPSSLIIKARCGMLNINARSFLSNTTSTSLIQLLPSLARGFPKCYAIRFNFNFGSPRDCYLHSLYNFGSVSC